MTEIPQTQKVLFLPSICGDFGVGTRNVDGPGPGEILVKVHSVGLNPGDWKTQRFEVAGKMVDAYPWVAGWDGSGEVVAVGVEGEGGFEKGDRVLFQNVEFKTRFGTYQQFVIAQVRSATKIPANLSYDEAATIPLVVATAYGGLYHPNPWGFGVVLPPSQGSEAKGEAKGIDVKGEPVVVIGGASGVGQMFIQLASLSGFSPIITTASLKHSAHLTSLGATHVLDRNLSNEEVKEQVRELTGGKPLRYAYDAIGAPATVDLGLYILDAPSYGHALAQLGAVDPFIATPLGEAHQLADGKRINSFIAILQQGEGTPDNVGLFKGLYERLGGEGGWLATGVVKPTRIEVLPNGLEGIKDGIAKLERDEVSGLKLIGHPQETA